jgi:hypothetical protein
MRWIGSSDAYKAAIHRAVARSIDFPKEFAALEKQVEEIKARGYKPKREERALQQVRDERRSLQIQQKIAQGTWNR